MDHPGTQNSQQDESKKSDALLVNNEIIRSLGRKARQRLDEERSKRREIQRFENQLDADAPQQPLAETIVVPPLKFHQRKKRKYAPRKKNALLSEAEAFAAAENGTSTPVAVEHIRVDRWMPDVSHLSSRLNAPAGTGITYSSVVQLHGLPMGTTLAPIRRFFSGLDPFRIVILLPLTTSLSSRQDCIPELDADHNKPPRKGVRVERYQNLRVLIKFDSAPTASLAVQRSGEILQLPLAKQGAALAVTPVSKSVANYLIKNLGVEADPGQSLDQTIQQMDVRLDPMVSPILWDAAIYELHLTVPPSTKSPACLLQLRPKFWTRARNLQKRKSIAQQRETICQWNDYRTQLRRQVEQLARPIQLLELDPALSLVDPVLSLTLHAIDACNREMERIEQAVTVATRWNRLADTRMPAVVAASISRCNTATLP